MTLTIQRDIMLLVGALIERTICSVICYAYFLQLSALIGIGSKRPRLMSSFLLRQENQLRPLPTPRSWVDATLQ